MNKRLIVKVKPVSPSQEERADRIIKFKIITDNDLESTKDFYKMNIQSAIDLQLIVEKWYKKHSKKQRGLLHLVIDAIAIHEGMPEELIKEGIKQAYGVKIEYKGILIPKPSRMMTTVEYNMLINGAILEAAELGLNVKDYKQEYEQLKQRAEEQARYERTLDDLPIPAESYEVMDDVPAEKALPPAVEHSAPVENICPECGSFISDQKAGCQTCGGMGIF